MKKILAILLLFSMPFWIGREFSFEDVVRNRIEERIQDIYIEGIHIKERWRREDELLYLIGSDTNTATRIRLYSLWGAELLAAKMPIYTNDYEMLDRILYRADKLVEGNVTLGLKNCSGGVEALYDMRLKLIEWQKKHLEELLAASKSVQKDDLNTVRWWRHCYRSLFGMYRSVVNRLEGWWIPHEFEVYKVPQDVRERIRTKVEKCLGRKIRPPEEALRRRDWDTETYRKVFNDQLP